MAVVHFVLAETSKTPFYVAAGILVLWAIVLARLGLSRDRFPGSGPGGRRVMALSLVFMLGVMATAVATASKPEHEGKSQLKPVQTTALGLPISAPPAKSAAPAAPAPAAPAPTNTIAVQANPQLLKFTETQLTAKAGKDTLRFDNPAQIPHNVQIEGAGAKKIGGTKTLAHGKTSVQLDLTPGTYTFYCSIPGHRQAGMQGTLTVK
jgi:plastocyanin